MDWSSAKRPSSSYAGWTISEIWEGAADSITYDSSCPPPITLVCGPGNSGKSTFSRLLLNTLSHRFKRVGYLNTDVGQPDFTPPGCLSLHVIDKQTPGIGYDALVDVLRYMSPTHVVQMRVSVETKNLPTGFSWLEKNEKTSVNLIEIPTVYEPFTRLQCLPRELNISTYKELADFLASITPYRVPLSRIKVKHLHQLVPSSEVNHSLDAIIVGLAVSSCVPPSSEHCTPWCVGLVVSEDE